MAEIERTVTINAPVERVFGYLDEPTNLPEIWSRSGRWSRRRS